MFYYSAVHISLIQGYRVTQSLTGLWSHSRNPDMLSQLPTVRSSLHLDLIDIVFYYSPVDCHGSWHSVSVKLIAFVGGHEVHLITKSGMCVSFPATKSQLVVDTLPGSHFAFCMYMYVHISIVLYLVAFEGIGVR